MAKRKVAETKVADPDWDAMNSDEFADAITKCVQEAPAALTCADMDRIESIWREDMRNRRCALAMLTKPGADLMKGVENDRELAAAIAEVYVRIPALIQFTDTLRELYEKMRGWSIVALAGREDMQELIDTAEKERAA
jgi:hypothetical protein